MSGPAIEHVRSAAYRIPTEHPESDGTLEWDSVTVVVAEADAGGQTGIGYTYADRAASVLIDGIPCVKMKVGRDTGADLPRAAAVREAIGSDAELYVDANGAYSRKQALAMADGFAALGVSWFEEPVSSNDLAGLRLIRDRAPAGIDVTAGEYGSQPGYFRRMLGAEAIDVLQADATRCCGITGLLDVGALCTAHELPFSAHCAPQIHAHAAGAIGRLIHCEYFHTHARAEAMLFDGVLTPEHGRLLPDAARPGMGLELKRDDAERWRL